MAVIRAKANRVYSYIYSARVPTSLAHVVVAMVRVSPEAISRCVTRIGRLDVASRLLGSFRNACLIRTPQQSQGPPPRAADLSQHGFANTAHGMT